MLCNLVNFIPYYHTSRPVLIVTKKNAFTVYIIKHKIRMGSFGTHAAHMLNCIGHL